VPTLNLVEPQAFLLQADVGLASDDDVVEHLDVEQFARFDDLFRYFDVFGAGGRVPRGVIVYHYQGGAVLPHRLLKQLANPDDGGVNAAFIDLRRGQHLVLGYYLNTPTAVAAF